MRKERGIFRRKTESRRRNFQILAIAASEIGCRWAGRALPPPGGGGKRGRDTKVSLPLLTPQPFLRTRLPSVARLKARGPQGRLVLQGSTLDRSGAFRSVPPPPCTVWPRTVMRGKSRKLTSGHNSVPKSARRTEPSPRFAARPKGVAAQRRVWGSQEGAREPYGALAPFCLRRQTAASSQNPAAGSGSTQIPRVFFNFPCLQLTFPIFHGILNYRKQKEPMPASISSLINGIRHLVLPTPAGGKISQP